VAHTSNRIGLNAAIEAIRAGEHGKDFSVAVNEICKRDTSSATAIKDNVNFIYLKKSNIHRLV
jgi:methyl-accepting chemotaxis protein